MKKILFVNGIFGKTIISMPLGIYQLASIIRHNGFLNTHIYDPCVYGDHVDIAVKRVLEINPDILAISVIQVNSKKVIQFVENIREAKKGIMIILGGHGPSLAPDFYLNHNVDMVFIGDSDVSLPMFIEKFNQNCNLYDIPGIAYIDSSNKMIFNEPPERIKNLDELPMMARDTLPLLLEKYGKNICVSLSSSRGCYKNCSYCSVRSYNALQKGKIYRERSVESLIDEIKWLNDTYGVFKFNFIDDNFIPQCINDANEKIFRFCEGIEKLKINGFRMFIYCRVDNIWKDVIGRLKEIGLHGIFIGIESINQTDLDLYGKRIYSIDIIRAMDSLNSLGFSCDINANFKIKTGFISFNPYSTIDSLKNNLSFLKKHHIIPAKFCTVLYPQPKTRIYDVLKNDYLLNKDGSAKFIEDEVSLIYKYSKDIVNYIWPFRDRVRLPYKFNLELGTDTSSEYLNKKRLELDNLCFEALNELLITENCFYDEIKQKYLTIFNGYRTDEELLRMLSYLEKKCGISNDNPALILLR